MGEGLEAASTCQQGQESANKAKGKACFTADTFRHNLVLESKLETSTCVMTQLYPGFTGLAGTMHFTKNREAIQVFLADKSK